MNLFREDLNGKMNEAGEAEEKAAAMIAEAVEMSIESTGANKWLVARYLRQLAGEVEIQSEASGWDELGHDYEVEE